MLAGGAAGLLAPPRAPGLEAAYADCFLALAYHRLGRPHEARAALDGAMTWAETVQRGQLGENFLFQRLELFLARREAEALVGRPGAVSLSRPGP